MILHFFTAPFLSLVTGRWKEPVADGFFPLKKEMCFSFYLLLVWRFFE